MPEPCDLVIRGATLYDAALAGVVASVANHPSRRVRRALVTAARAGRGARRRL